MKFELVKKKFELPPILPKFPVPCNFLINIVY